MCALCTLNDTLTHRHTAACLYEWCESIGFTEDDAQQPQKAKQRRKYTFEATRLRSTTTLNKLGYYIFGYIGRRTSNSNKYTFYTQRVKRTNRKKRRSFHTAKKNREEFFHVRYIPDCESFVQFYREFLIENAGNLHKNQSFYDIL